MRYEITWQAAAYACVLLSIRYLEVFGGGLVVFVASSSYTIRLKEAASKLAADAKSDEKDEGSVGLNVAEHFGEKAYMGEVKYRSRKVVED